MRAKNMTEAEIRKEDIDFARGTAKKYQSEFDRKRVFKSLICAKALAENLAAAGLNIEGTGDFCKINDLAEEYEFTDIFCNSYFLDVKAVIDGRYVLIPKKHFNEGILPDVYVAANYDVSRGKVIISGFIEPSKIINARDDGKYRIIDISDLKPSSELKNFLKESKTITVNDVNHDKYSYLPSELAFIDCDTKKDILKHLIECEKCRRNLSQLYDFEEKMKKFREYPDVFEFAKPEEDKAVDEIVAEESRAENDPLQILYGNTNSSALYSISETESGSDESKEEIRNLFAAKDYSEDLPEGMTEKAFEREKEINEFDFDTDFKLPDDIYIPRADYSFEEEPFEIVEEVSETENRDDFVMPGITEKSEPENEIFDIENINGGEISEEINLPVKDQSEFIAETAEEKKSDDNEKTPSEVEYSDISDENNRNEFEVPGTEEVENLKQVPENADNSGAQSDFPVDFEVAGTETESNFTDIQSADSTEIKDTSIVSGTLAGAAKLSGEDLSFSFERPVVEQKPEEKDPLNEQLDFVLPEKTDFTTAADAPPVEVHPETNEDNMLSFELAAKQHNSSNDYYKSSDDETDGIVFVKPKISAEDNTNESESDFEKTLTELSDVEGIGMNENKEPNQEIEQSYPDFVRPAGVTDFTSEEKLPEIDYNNDNAFSLSESEPLKPDNKDPGLNENSGKILFEEEDYSSSEDENKPDALMPETLQEYEIQEPGDFYEEDFNNTDEIIENTEPENTNQTAFEYNDTNQADGNISENNDMNNFFDEAEAETESKNSAESNATNEIENDVLSEEDFLRENPRKKIPGSFFNDMDEFEELEDDDDVEYESSNINNSLKIFLVSLIIVVAVVSGFLAVKKINGNRINALNEIKPTQKINTPDYGETGNMTQNNKVFAGVSSMKWEIPKGLTADEKRYLTMFANAVNENIKDLLVDFSSNVSPREIHVEINFDLNTKFKNAKIIQQSGNNTLDDIVLQSVNKAGKTAKTPENVPFDNSQSENKKTVLKIGF